MCVCVHNRYCCIYTWWSSVCISLLINKSNNLRWKYLFKKTQAPTTRISTLLGILYGIYLQLKMYVHVKQAINLTKLHKHREQYVSKVHYGHKDTNRPQLANRSLLQIYSQHSWHLKHKLTTKKRNNSQLKGYVPTNKNKVTINPMKT